ncbi:MAG: helix-turn-helix domain-containing protein [Marvinbryantia sp.]|uniref:helix-turn-helix domain-containing protein n=1 Tax=Marvinbryantia sp. TaxID=2496532 RepID=UPI0039999478
MNEESIKKTISTNITRYRELSGMTQKELAQKLNVTPSRISNWEQGANCPTIDILFKVCEVLGVSINDIYGVYPEAKIRMSYDEIEHIKKYRVLDQHGKEMVDFTLQKEWERSTKIVSFETPVLNAASERPDATIEDKLQTNSIMQDDSEWE